MKRSTTCEDCKTVARVGRWADHCGWPCSLFGFADLLGPRAIVARRRWLTRRGVYQVQPMPSAFDVLNSDGGCVCGYGCPRGDGCRYVDEPTCHSCHRLLGPDAEEQGEAGSVVLCGFCIREAQEEAPHP